MKMSAASVPSLSPQPSVSSLPQREGPLSLSCQILKSCPLGLFSIRQPPLSQCPQGTSNTILAQPLSQHWGWFQAPPKSTNQATVEIKKSPSHKSESQFPFSWDFHKKAWICSKVLAMWPLFTYFALFQKYIFQIDGRELYILEETFSIFVEMKCGVKVSKNDISGPGELNTNWNVCLSVQTLWFHQSALKIFANTLPIE